MPAGSRESRWKGAGMIKRLWVEHAPVGVQMWVHQKAYEWNPPKVIAEHLPVSVLYWAYIYTGVKAIRSNETVPDVRYVDILKRIPVRKP